MNAVVNNTTYEDVQWVDETMSFETDMTFAEIDSAFTPGQNATITLYEEEQEVAMYYNKGIDSVTVTGHDPRVVSVKFNVTQITANAETQIRADMENSDGAIEELASIISDFSEIDFQGMAEELQSHQETISTWFSHANDISEFNDNLRKEGGILDTINVRLSALEHVAGIVSIEPTVSEEGE